MTVEIKICGLMRPEAVDVALDAGADMVGFVFFPPSPRHLNFRPRGRSEPALLAAPARLRYRSMPTTIF